MSVELCLPSMAGDREEMCSESSRRKMQDKEETTSEASWTAVTKGKGKILLLVLGCQLDTLWGEYGGAMQVRAVVNQKVKRKGLKPQFRGTRRKASP